MYPRNNATPLPILVGTITQISDGVVQTTGVSVSISKNSGAFVAGANTPTVEQGEWSYTPSQAETDCDSLRIVLYKTGCYSRSIQVVFTASGSFGYAGTDQSKITNNSATVNLSGTTIKTATDIETDTQDIQDRLPSGLVDGRMASIAQVVGDKTGYKLASDGLSLVTQWAVAITGNITGNVTGSVGSISGVTFPANFGLLGIDGSGAIGEVILVYELDGGALTANNAGDPIASIVWNALTTATYTDQSFGDRILISNNNTREISVTGSGHIASVLHDAEPNAIPEDAFQTGAWSARVLASDAVTEVVNGVWNEPTSGHTTAGTTGKALIDSGAAGNPWSTDLATGYSGTQAGNILNEVKVKTDTITTPTINVYPVSASTPERVQGTTLTFYRNESRSVSVVTDFTLTSLTLQFTVEDPDGVDIYTLANGSITRSNQTFTVPVTTAVTGNLGQYRWSMRDISGGGSSVIVMGVLTVQEAASNV